MRTTTEIEAFYDGGKKAGALIRQFSANLLQTTIVFEIDGGPIIHAFQQTRFGLDVFDWSEYKYVDHLEGSDVEVKASAEPLLRDSTAKPVPSYAAHLVLKEFLATNEPQRKFKQFDEGSPLSISPAVFVRQGIEDVETPWGNREALKVISEVDGRLGNTFWCANESVVKSDWQGATSYATNDVDFVLRDLNAEVQTVISEVLESGRVGER